MAGTPATARAPARSKAARARAHPRGTTPAGSEGGNSRARVVGSAEAERARDAYRYGVHLRTTGFAAHTGGGGAESPRFLRSKTCSVSNRVRVPGWGEEVSLPCRS